MSAETITEAKPLKIRGVCREQVIETDADNLLIHCPARVGMACHASATIVICGRQFSSCAGGLRREDY
jgi:hypothetical protein